jgi:phage host-nuclease inhibitor protein Gam
METVEQEQLPATVEEIAAWMAGASPAAVEAQASWWLRSLGEAQGEAQRLMERRDAELDMVARHYARALAPVQDRAAALERCLEAMAERMTYARGKKSLALAWGVVGRRTQPARVSVTDPDVALATIRTLLPSAVRVKESVDVKAATPAVLAAVSEGVAVDGFELVPAKDVAYATPNSAAAQGVA